MGIDAVAVLRIPFLSPRSPSAGEPSAGYHVVHRGDASLVHTFHGFHAAAPDEHALALRRALGAELDRHQDPRGIFFFPDACEPQGASYEALVAELEGAGVWAPKVEASHVPERYANPAPDTHEALVAQLIAALGRDAATQIDLMAQVNAMLLTSGAAHAETAEESRALFLRLTEVLGDDFAKAYDASVRSKVLAEQAARDASLARGQQWMNRVEQGEPLISGEDMSAFLAGNGMSAVLSGLDPSVREALERELGTLDAVALADTDLAMQLAKAFRKS